MTPEQEEEYYKQVGLLFGKLTANIKEGHWRIVRNYASKHNKGFAIYWEHRFPSKELHAMRIIWGEEQFLNKHPVEEFVENTTYQINQYLRTTS